MSTSLDSTPGSGPVTDDGSSFPFAQELREQHDALRAVVRWFQAEIGAGAPAARAEAREFLRVLSEQLAEHFRYEELAGLGGALDSRDPRLRIWAQELVRQHRAFEVRTGALRRQLEEAPGEGLPAPLIAELGELFAGLRRHDAEENALLTWIAQRPAAAAQQLP